MGQLLGQALSESGFQVTLAANGREGLRLAKDQDVAIVDLMMPVLDGFDMVRSLRSQDIYIPILFLTARDSTDSLVKALALGGDDYQIKPFKLAELVARLHSLLQTGECVDLRRHRV